jgi:hypothetical protein
MMWKLRTQLYDANAYTLRGWIKNKRRRLQQDKPIVYAFYAPIVRFGQESVAQSTREAKIAETDQQLLEVWSSSWAEAGYQPVLLSLSHAQKHEHYEPYVYALSKVQLLGAGGRNQEYNEYCFLRYLAMATVGGGLLSDYDVMPLTGNQPLQPLDDRFTVYQKTLNKAGAVPSLASGRASEWDRMANLILQISQTPPPEGGWSDMLALMQAERRKPGTYVLRNEVVGYREAMQDPDNICKSTSNAWAIHLSHYDVLSMGYRVHDRPQVAKDFVRKYKSKCVNGVPTS